MSKKTEEVFFRQFFHRKKENCTSKLPLNATTASTNNYIFTPVEKHELVTVKTRIIGDYANADTATRPYNNNRLYGTPRM